MSKRKSKGKDDAALLATAESLSADGKRDLIYQLGPDAKRLKKNDPRDLTAIEAAAKKEAKQKETQFAKALGTSPKDQIRDEKSLTGLRNLGATCYMNSLLQCLFMNVAFRKGIYSWRSTRPPKPRQEEQAQGKERAATADDGDSGVDAAASSKEPIDVEMADASSSADAAPLEADTEEVAEEICRQLQTLFAHLQHSSLACYDPAKLTEALNLNVSVQQDAQEFNQLLLNFLESQLKHSPEPSIQKLVEDNFRGASCYRTQCLACKQTSEGSKVRHPFYELQLNIRPTLKAALDEYTLKEELNGDNQYDCDHCKGKRDATRQIALVTLPPVLSLQLLRFVYDPFKDAKKKVSDAIEFPEFLDASSFLFGAEEDGSSGGGGGGGGGGDDECSYRLSAVLMHTGSSAHSGHYTARILEQTPEERWWTFNDEQVHEESWDEGAAATKAGVNGVTLIKPGSEKTPKEARGRGRMFASKTAYMLLYTRESVVEDAKKAAAGVQAPPELRGEIEEASIELRRQAEEHASQAADHAKDLAMRKQLAEEIVPSLKCAPSDADGRWVSAAWLHTCLAQGFVDAGEIDNGPLVCPHGEFADPSHVASGAMKLISANAWAKLHRAFGGGPELRASGCAACVNLALQSKQEVASAAEHEQMLLLALKGGAAEEEEAEARTGGGFWVPKQLERSLNKWRGSGVTDATSELVCPHGGLRPLEAHGRLVSSGAWRHVLALFPQSQPYPTKGVGTLPTSTRQICEACGRTEADEAVRAAEAKAESKELNAQRLSQRQRLQRLSSLQETPLDVDTLRNAVFGGRDKPLVALCGNWLRRWRLHVDATKASNVKPPGPIEGAQLCEHGKMVVRPELALGRLLYERLLPPNQPRTASELARDTEMATDIALVTASEAAELAANHSDGAEVEALLSTLPQCTPQWPILKLLVDESRQGGGEGVALALAKGGGGGGEEEGVSPCCAALFKTTPLVCAMCSTEQAEAVMAGVREYADASLHIVKLKALPPTAAAGGGGKENVGGGCGSSAAAAVKTAAAAVVAAASPAPEAAAGSSRRRSSRAGAGATLSVKASSTMTVLNLKLLVMQSAEGDAAPNQQRLFFEGAELDDDSATLADVGVMPDSTLQLVVDLSREAELHDALEKNAAQQGGGKNRTLEEGFMGSALIGGRPSLSAVSPAPPPPPPATA